MGLLSNFIADQSKRIQNVKDTFSLIGSNIAQGKLFEGVPVAKKYENTVLGNVATNLTKPATLAAAVIAPAVIANPIATAKLLGLTSVKGVATASAVGLVGYPLLKSPTIVRTLYEIPKQTTKLGENIAISVENPSGKNIINIFKESPLAIGGFTALAGVGAAGLVSSIWNTEAVKENTKATQDILTKGNDFIKPPADDKKKGADDKKKGADDVKKPDDVKKDIIEPPREKDKGAEVITTGNLIPSPVVPPPSAAPKKKRKAAKKKKKAAPKKKKAAPKKKKAAPKKKRKVKKAKKYKKKLTIKKRKKAKK